MSGICSDTREDVVVNVDLIEICGVTTFKVKRHLTVFSCINFVKFCRNFLKVLKILPSRAALYIRKLTHEFNIL